MNAMRSNQLEIAHSIARRVLVRVSTTDVPRTYGYPPKLLTYVMAQSRAAIRCYEANDDEAITFASRAHSAMFEFEEACEVVADLRSQWETATGQTEYLSNAEQIAANARAYADSNEVSR